jgi:hypothetical protein
LNDTTPVFVGDIGMVTSPKIGISVPMVYCDRALTVGRDRRVVSRPTGFYVRYSF